MIRLGLRLTLNGGREAAARLVVTAFAVALGVGMLLTALGGAHAIKAQSDRSAWLDSSPSGAGGPPVATAAAAPGAADVVPLWWQHTEDQFGSHPLDRIDLAATGPTSPRPPGLTRLPRAGEFYASPALSRLLRSTPSDELAARLPGRQVGILGAAALPTPNALIVVVGRSVGDLSRLPDASKIDAIATDVSNDGPTSATSTRLAVILGAGALALLFPVLVFIGTATRLAAARREERFAAMRLVGATPRQVAVIAAVEASVAALIGVVVGFVLFLLLRPVLSGISFTGQPFAAGDLSLGPTEVVVVALGVPTAAVLAARIALRRVHISPLGVSRRVTPKPPRAIRLIPLAAGVAELAYFAAVGHPQSTGDQLWAYLLGFLMIMVGLLVAGPWLTMTAALLLARRTGRPAVLIAARRLADDPRGAFRSISGLVLALFVTSAAVGIITTIVSSHAKSTNGAAAGDTIVDQFFARTSSGIAPAIAALPGSLVTDLQAVPGVGGVTVIHSDPHAGHLHNGAPKGLVSCAQLTRTPAVGHCVAGASTAEVTPDFGSTGRVTSTAARSSPTWPAADESPNALRGLPVQSLVVATDGSTVAIERVRTLLETALPEQGVPTTLGEISYRNARQLDELQHMTTVVILASLLVAGCSLAVTVTGGVSERRRPFRLLRLTGVPLGVLRRMVALEAAVPLLVLAAVAGAAGLTAADLFLHSQLNETLRPLGSEYYLIVLTGLLLSLAIVASALPIIERISRPGLVRHD